MPKIEHHPTFDIKDSSKVQCFQSCPRRYFYRYILGWERIIPNIHLIFGEAWHIAQETLLRLGYSDKSIAAAYVELEDYYRQHFSEHQDLNNFPKTPGNALIALDSYRKKYKDDNFQPIFTEVAGTVPIDEKRKIHFRLDAIIKDGKDLLIMDHKTGSRNSQTWSDGWRLSFQMSTYAHALYCLESLFQLQDPELNVYGVLINGTFFYKGRPPEHLRVKIRKTKDMMRVWLWNAIYWLDQIDFEMQRLWECKEDDDVLQAFPMNTQSCTEYGGCPYFDFCMSWPNPLKAIQEEPPPEFKKEFWNPEDGARDAKVLFYDGEVKEKESKDA